MHSRRARPRGRSNVPQDRCTRCIWDHKGCDSAKPVCGRCHKSPERCKWPEGNPSRTGLRELLSSERVNKENAQGEAPDGDGNGVGSAEETSTSNATGTQLVIRGEQVEAGTIQLCQLVTQVGPSTTTVVLSQPVPVEQQREEHFSPELLRLERVRLAILVGTVAHTNRCQDHQAKTPASKGSIMEKDHHAQEQVGSRGSGHNVQQDPESPSKRGNRDMGEDDERLAAWLNT